MRLTTALLFFIMFLTPAGAETAAERSAKLDQLFGTLQAKDQSAQTSLAEQNIWTLWMQSDSEKDDVLLADATQAMQFGNFDKCETLLNQLLKTNPSYAEAWNKRATLNFILGRFDESLADIVKTLELEPRHFGALAGRGMIYERQGKELEALRAYREALTVNPHMINVRVAVEKLKSLEPEL
jgi:tetratricopeptide (TPR) repeat protein